MRHSHKKKILFVLKKRNYSYGISYGLKVSCTLVAECISDYVETKIVEVVDGNSIDKEVYNYKPDFVVLEAIWCPPYKLEELLKLHKKINWNIRLHSKIPFLAQEKLAMQWLAEYNRLSGLYKNLTLSANNDRFAAEINSILNYDLEYTPNCYPIDDSIMPNTRAVGDVLDIGCFGALRILKNTLMQAVCAIHVANCLKKKLRFHINNSSSFEKEGNPILNNLINLFKQTPHELVIHNWEGHAHFMRIVNRMDAGMQVSFTESFNLTAADFVSSGIPLVGSPEIEFLSCQYQANPTDFQDICNKLEFALRYKTVGFHVINEYLLRKHTKRAIEQWVKIIK